MIKLKDVYLKSIVMTVKLDIVILVTIKLDKHVISVKMVMLYGITYVIIDVHMAYIKELIQTAPLLAKIVTVNVIIVMVQLQTNV